MSKTGISALKRPVDSAASSKIDDKHTVDVDRLHWCPFIGGMGASATLGVLLNIFV
jgi:hypothetical protein